METHLGYRLRYVESTDSTNAECKRMVEQGEDGHNLLLWADFQSAGRGQQGNSWESQKGKNLTFTLCVQPSFLPAREQFLLSEVVSLSISRMLDGQTGDFCIKWPNDIYYGEKKIAGVLIEHCLKSSFVSQSYIGIGININQETFLSDAPNPVSLYQITGKKTDRRFLLERFVSAFSYYYGLLEGGRVDEIRREYCKHLFRKDGYHRYQDAKGEFDARILSVSVDGTLALEDEERQERHYAFKEVRYVFPWRVCE